MPLAALYNSHQFTICFDGASRDRTPETTVGAAILLTDTAKKAYIVQRRKQADTANAAELDGFHAALRLALWISEKREAHALRAHAPIAPTTYDFLGDSSYVIQLATTGVMNALAGPDRTDSDSWIRKIPNFDRLAECGALVRTLLSRPGVSTTYAFHRRRYNAAPDELCNAYLDKREPELAKLGRVARVAFDESVFDTAIDWPSRRFLPRELFAEWRRVIALLVADCVSERDMMLVLMAPRLLLSFLPRHRYAAHFAQFQSREDVVQYVADLVPLPRTPEPSTLDERVRRFLHEGTPGKALDAVIAPATTVEATTEITSRLWPQTASSPPLDLRVPACGDTLQALDIQLMQLIAVRRLRNKKAADAGGWTKELLLAAGIPTVFPLLNLMYTRFAQMPERVRRLITTDRGLLLNQGPKVRPASVGSLWAKLWWHHQLCRYSFPLLPNQIPAADATAVLNQMVRRGPVLKTDCSNAFHSVERYIIRDQLVQLKLNHLFQLWTIFYASPTTIRFRRAAGPLSITLTRGVRAGCVSAVWLFQLAMREPLLYIEKHVARPLAVVDDIYIPATAECVPQISPALRAIGLSLNESKTCLMQPRSTSKVLGTWISSDGIVPITVLKPVEAEVAAVCTAISSFHVRYHLLTCLFHRYTYALRYLVADNAHQIIATMSSMWQSAIKEMAGGDIPSLLFSAPLEAGGFAAGYECFLDAWKVVQNHSLTKYAAIFGLATPVRVETPQDTERVVRQAWFRKQRAKPGATDGIPEGLLTLHELNERQPMEDWLVNLPTYDWCLRNEEFASALLLRVGRTPASFTPCPIRSHFGTSPEQLWHHALKCPRCSHRVPRHNAVVNALALTLRKYGVVISTLPGSKPRPETVRNPCANADENMQEKGPDAEVHLDGVFCIDVAITAGSQGEASKTADLLARTYNYKLRLYQEWEAFYGMKCYPIIFSVFGNIHTRSRSIIESWAKMLHKPRLAHEIIVNCGKALIATTTAALRRSELAAKIATARAQLASQSPARAPSQASAAVAPPAPFSTSPSSPVFGSSAGQLDTATTA